MKEWLAVNNSFPTGGVQKILKYCTLGEFNEKLIVFGKFKYTLNLRCLINRLNSKIHVFLTWSNLLVESSARPVCLNCSLAQFTTTLEK
jgi:hypothetical protein